MLEKDRERSKPKSFSSRAQYPICPVSWEDDERFAVMASENKPTVLVTGEKSLIYCSFVKNLALNVDSDNFSGMSAFKAVVIFLSVYMHDKVWTHGDSLLEGYNICLGCNSVYYLLQLKKRIILLCGLSLGSWFG